MRLESPQFRILGGMGASMVRHEPHGPISQALRRKIQTSDDGDAELARKLGVNRKTVAKWRRRNTIEDLPRGTKRRGSTILNAEEEAIVVAMRQRTLLPLDDCLFSLQQTIPHLTRSALHRCFVRHGVNRLPLQRRRRRAIGHLLIDRQEIRAKQGPVLLFQAMDMASMLVFAATCEPAPKAMLRFLRLVIESFPYRIQTIAIDSTWVADIPQRRARLDPIAALCAKHGIGQRRTLPVLTGNQIKSVRHAFEDAGHSNQRPYAKADIDAHVQRFLTGYNYSRRLKRLGGITPVEYTCRELRKSSVRSRAVRSSQALPLAPGFGAPSR